MNEKFVKIAMGQMLVEGGQQDANIHRAIVMIKDAAAKNCQIIVLPECLDCG